MKNWLKRTWCRVMHRRWHDVESGTDTHGRDLEWSRCICCDRQWGLREAQTRVEVVYDD